MKSLKVTIPLVAARSLSRTKVEDKLFCPAGSLSRRFLNFLARLLYAGANVIDGVVNGPSRAFHRTARPSAGNNRQDQHWQCEDYFQESRIEWFIN
jgi:hypothetical protein